MKVEYLNPFVDATLTTLKTMLNTEAQRGALALKQSNRTDAEITSVIGMSGKLKGSIVLAFGQKVAGELVKRMLYLDGDISEAEISDGVGELCNIIGGSAKVELNKMGLDLEISIPNVIFGSGLTIVNNPAYPTLVVPFTTDVGGFAIEVCLMKA